MKTIIHDHMKSLGRWLVCFSVAVVVYLVVFDYARTLSLSPLAQATQIVLGADQWCPYNCTPKSKMPGFVVEIAQVVFAQSNITNDYRVFPWPRAIDMAKRGEIDVVIGATKAEVPKFFFPSLSKVCRGLHLLSNLNNLGVLKV
jgi:hypothetical protein